jgi:uncharacterized protein involved in outer membrane biogenesis
MKKILVIIGSVFVLFVCAALLLPVFVDANKYRPQIEKLVEENINADLELGKLTLSLWGGLHIEVEKLVLSEKGSHGAKPIFAMNDAKLEIPIMSVLSAHPDVTVSVKNPEIHVTSELDGKLNVAKIAKPAAAPQDASAEARPAPGKSNAGMATALPFELSFHIVEGTLVYSDLKKNTSTTVKGFNFDLKKFGINRAFDFSFNSNLDVKEMKDLTLRGPLDLHGTAGIYMGSAGLDHADFESDLDMSGLFIKYGKLMDKAEKAPLKVAVKLTATDKDLKIDKVHLQIEDASVDVTGRVIDFSSPVLDLQIVSSKFVFDHWQQVLEPLKEFDMKGSATFNVKVTGAVATMSFQGSAGLSNVSLRVPGIVPRITELNSELAFSNDTATLSATSLKMGESDLSMDGTVRSFTKPIIVFNVRSNFLDVDALLPQKSPEQVRADETQAKADAQKAGATPDAVDLEKTVSGPIVALKKNPIARALDFTGNVHFAKIVAHRAPFTNLNAEITFRDLVMTLKKANADTFAGKGSFTSSIDFRGADPVYSVSAEVSGMDVNAAISNQMVSAKDSLFGKLNSKFEVSGSGLSKAKVTQNLKGKGNFRIDNGSWSALAALKAVGDKLKSFTGADKLAGIQITDKFRDLKSDFTIAGGHFNIVNMVADMEGANTTLNGAGWVDFDMNIDLDGHMIVPNSDVEGTPPEFRVAGGRASYPYGITDKITSPRPKMDKFKDIALAYAKMGGKKAVVDVVKKALGGSDNQQVKDLLKKFSF